MADDSQNLETSQTPGSGTDIGPDKDPLGSPQGQKAEQDLNKLINPAVPPSDQYPDPMKTREGIARQKQIDQANAALQEQLEDSKRLQKRVDEFDQRYQSGMQEIQGEIKDIDKERAQPPQLLPLSQRPEADLHAANQLQWSWPNTLLTLGVALAGIAGKHKGGTLSNYFLGSFFQAYAAGQQERQNRMAQQWSKTNEEIYKENQQRLSDYRAKLSDERFDLSIKIGLMKNMADQYKDLPMQKALETQNINIIKAQLSQYEKGLHDYLSQYKATWMAKQQLVKSGYGAEYNKFLEDKFHEAYQRWPANTAERDSMMEQNPPSKWYEWRVKGKSGGSSSSGSTEKIDPTTGRPVQKNSSTTGNQSLRSSPTSAPTPSSNTSGSSSGTSQDPVFGVGSQEPASPEEKQRFEDLFNK